MKTFYLAFLGVVLPGWLWAARPLTEATFTQVINNVNVLPEASKTPTPAKLNALFKTPDLLRTGVDSLAELTAADQTITRVGANTVFSFEADGRNINLQQGSLLFHSPKGKGGGTIKTRSASAAVLGTTIVIVATVNGGFKAIVLEGRGQIRLPNGNFRNLQAGQLVFVLPGAPQFGPVLNINLDTLVKGSRLINGFQAKLPSLEKIQLEIVRQLRQIAVGKAEDTGLLVGDNATKEGVQVVDSSLLERAVGESPLQSALKRDVIIDSSVLDRSQVFLDKFPITFKGETFTQRGFVGNNITIASPFVDLSPYTTGDLNSFDIFAAETITISKPTQFQGMVSSLQQFEFSLTAGGGFDIASGAGISLFGVGDFNLQAGTSFSLVGGGITNSSGRGVELSTVPDSGTVFGDIQLSSYTLKGAPIGVEAGNVTINNSFFQILSGPGFPGVFLKAANNLNASSSSIFGIGGSSLLHATAGNTLNLSGVALVNFSSITLEARTVVLQNIDFPSGSSVLLRSQTGLLAANPNTGQSAVPGYVNFISNVTHGGSPAELQVGGAITLSTFP